MTTKLSVILNLALAGALIFVWMNPRTPGAASAPPAAAKAEQTSAPAVAEPAPPATPSTVVKTRPFRWDQLVSTNGYRTFVANLRAAGCPEATVEDIVRGDAERAFSFKRSELHMARIQAGHWSAQSQMQMVAYLLGQASSPTVEVAANTVSLPANRPPSSEVADNTASPYASHSPTVEVAANSVSPYANRLPPAGNPFSTSFNLRKVDSKALGQNDKQIQAFNNVRQDSLQQVGVENQGSTKDTADPGYVAQAQEPEDTANSPLPGSYLWMAAAQQAYDYSVGQLQQRASQN